MSHPHVIIYTDGSSRGNPGPGGWGAIVATADHVVEMGKGDRHTTNNKMELLAAIESLGFVRDLGSAFAIDVHPDSRYVINGITSWVFGWQKNGWKNSKKEDVLNRDLWEALAGVVADLQMSGSKISWNYTPGHAGIAGNDRADEIATKCADGENPNLYNGARSGYEVDLAFHTGDPAKLALKKSKSKTSSSVKAYSYVSLVGGKLMKHTTWTECEKRVKGTPGAKFKKSTSARDEKAIIASWGL